MAVTQETSDKLSTKDLMRSLIQTGQLDTAAQAEVATNSHGLRMSCPYLFNQAHMGLVFACISGPSVVDWRYRRRTWR